MLTEKVLIPGGTEQLHHLLDHAELEGNHALIIGPYCEFIAVRLIDMFSNIHIISDEYDSVLQYKLNTEVRDKIKVKMMDYAHTDFSDKYFDLIYAQASISIPERKTIIKEIKRILKSDGTICIGEIVSLKEPVPAFVRDIWERSGLEPLSLSEINKYYEDRGLNIINEKDLSSTLKDFYQKLRYQITKADKEEKEANKKFYSAIKHEADAYLKLGGDKFIGFKSLIMRKTN